jgi:hypothetical protein
MSNRGRTEVDACSSDRKHREELAMTSHDHNPALLTTTPPHAYVPSREYSSFPQLTLRASGSSGDCEKEITDAAHRATAADR